MLQPMCKLQHDFLATNKMYPYIYTQLNELVPDIFRSADTCVLESEDDDGTPVEPKVYATIICMLAINGALGIGAGSSTYIPQYNPKDVIKNTRFCTILMLYFSILQIEFEK